MMETEEEILERRFQWGLENGIIPPSSFYEREMLQHSMYIIDILSKIIERQQNRINILENPPVIMRKDN